MCYFHSMARDNAMSPSEVPPPLAPFKSSRGADGLLIIDIPQLEYKMAWRRTAGVYIAMALLLALLGLLAAAGMRSGNMIILYALIGWAIVLLVPALLLSRISAKTAYGITAGPRELRVWSRGPLDWGGDERTWDVAQIRTIGAYFEPPRYEGDCGSGLRIIEKDGRESFFLGHLERKDVEQIVALIRRAMSLEPPAAA
jgi:hypothetical protein